MFLVSSSDDAAVPSITTRGQPHTTHETRQRQTPIDLCLLKYIKHFLKNKINSVSPVHMEKSKWLKY